MNYRKFVLFLAPLAIMAIIFQNCSRANFNTAETSQGIEKSDNSSHIASQDAIVADSSTASSNAIKLLFTKSENDTVVNQFKDEDEILGKVIGLKYHNAEVCSEIIGKTDGACLNDKNWEKLPNSNWKFENNEWRLKKKAKLIGIGKYKVTFRNSESKDLSNIADLDILQSKGISQCVANVGQACETPQTLFYYYKSEEMSISQCHSLSFKNTRKDLGTCPNPGIGYKYAFQVCKAGIFDGTKEVKYRLYCAQSFAGASSGVIDCLGQCR